MKCILIAHEKNMNLGEGAKDGMYRPNCFHSNVYPEALTTNATVFADRVCKEASG